MPINGLPPTKMGCKRGRVSSYRRHRHAILCAIKRSIDLDPLWRPRTPLTSSFFIFLMKKWSKTTFCSKTSPILQPIFPFILIALRNFPSTQIIFLWFPKFYIIWQFTSPGWGAKTPHTPANASGGRGGAAPLDPPAPSCISDSWYILMCIWIIDQSYMEHDHWSKLYVALSLNKSYM